MEIMPKRIPYHNPIAKIKLIMDIKSTKKNLVYSMENVATTQFHSTMIIMYQLKSIVIDTESQ
jgi:hypothetical protein